jgi:hypothetical protein
MKTTTTAPVTLTARNGETITLHAGRMVTVAAIGSDSARINWTHKARALTYFAKVSIDDLLAPTN